MKDTSSKLLSLIFLGLLFVWFFNYQKNKIDNDETRRMSKREMLINKQERSVFLSTSANRLKNQKVPLFIFLHGMDGAWPNRKQTKYQYDYINSLAWKKNFIAVFPKGTDGVCGDQSEKYFFFSCWDTKTKKDFEFVKALKEALVNQYGVDPQKTYLLGFSNGGYFVADYFNSNNYKDFSGYGINSAGTKIARVDNNTKIALSVGKKDPYELNDMRKLRLDLIKKGYNEKFLYQEHSGSHEMSRKAIDDEIKFFLEK